MFGDVLGTYLPLCFGEVLDGIGFKKGNEKEMNRVDRDNKG